MYGAVFVARVLQPARVASSLTFAIAAFYLPSAAALRSLTRPRRTLPRAPRRRSTSATTSTVKPPAPKLGYEPTSTPGQRSTASASVGGDHALVRPVDAAPGTRSGCRAGTPPRSTRTSPPSRTGGRAGRRRSRSRSPARRRAGSRAGGCPAGSIAQRAAYSGSRVKRARRSAASSGTSSCGDAERGGDRLARQVVGRAAEAARDEEEVDARRLGAHEGSAIASISSGTAAVQAHLDAERSQPPREPRARSCSARRPRRARSRS